MQKELYYLKFDVTNARIILDSDKEQKSSNEYLIEGYRISRSQGKMLNEKLNKYRRVLIPDVELECKRLFRKCKVCGFVINRNDSATDWGGLCNRCRKDGEEERKRVYNRELYYKKKRTQHLNKYQAVLNTVQGQIYATPMEVIQSNIRGAMFSKGKTYRDLSKHLGIDEREFTKMFYGMYMDKEKLFKIADFIGVKYTELIKIPPGVTFETYYGIPYWWFGSTYVFNALKEKDEK